MGEDTQSADDSNPILRHSRNQQVDRLGAQLIEKTEKLQDKFQGSKPNKQNTSDTTKSKKGPAGGYDATPIPQAPPGYTLRITFHRAENLPYADIASLSADPYIIAVLKTSLLKRHKQDPDLKIRLPTVHKNINPVWDAQWIVANVPSSGFYMKCRLYDEDPADHDDRLGNVHVNVPSITESWQGFKEQSYEVKKRMGSKRAYTFRGCAALLSRSVKFRGSLIVSVENLGRTHDDNGGKAYTVGPLPWSRHYSPLIGRLTGTKDRDESKDGKPGVERYNFQAIQMQFRGPVPPELYHRYVEFKPFVAGMFTDHSLRGRILNRALHHQHARIYNYDKSTVYGSFDKPCMDLSRKFLEFVHYDQGGRIFTYVLTLDGQFRFTETGKEFGIDLLSKHTMHSDVSIYIAFSGEFFIRRLRHPHNPSKSHETDPATETLPPEDEEVEDHRSDADNIKFRDPKYYELVIDNDSGTYRPNNKMLPKLKAFLSANLPGLKIVTLDCQDDEEKMKKLKNEQREKKKSSGTQITYLQNNSMSSISSSDEEALDDRAAGRVSEKKYKREMHKYVGGGTDRYHWDEGKARGEEEDANEAMPARQPDGVVGGAGGEKRDHALMPEGGEAQEVGRKSQQEAKEEGEKRAERLDEHYEKQDASG